MIYAEDVYETILDVIRKDGRGKALSIDEYNNLCPLVNEQLYQDYYKKFEGNLESSDTLGYFKVFNEPIALTADTYSSAAVGTLPTDYYHVIGRPKTISGSTFRWVDIVTAQEHAKRQADALTQPTTTYPTCQIGGKSGDDLLQIQVYPSTITTIYLDYLRTANTPFLDYYISDTTLNYTYMEADDTVSVPAGSTYRDGTAGGGVGIVSLTEDWEWDYEDLYLIVSKFLTLMGIAYPDEVLLQAGLTNEAKMTQ